MFSVFSFNLTDLNFYLFQMLVGAVFAKRGGSPGLVVMGGDSCSKSGEFESRHCILDGHFS